MGRIMAPAQGHNSFQLNYRMFVLAVLGTIIVLLLAGLQLRTLRVNIIIIIIYKSGHKTAK